MEESVSIVIPVYEEEESVPHLYRSIKDVMEGLKRKYEIVFVDDGSKDWTFRLLEEIQKKDPAVVVVSFRRNFGQTAAMAAGFEYAGGDIIVTMDADLQNDPHDIGLLLSHLDGFDAAVGWRKGRDDPWLKRVSSIVANAVRNVISGDRVHDSACSLRVMRRECLAALPSFQGMHRFVPTLLRMAGYRVIEVPVRHRPRRAGRSKFTVQNRAVRAFVDLLAVCWMMKRRIRYRVVEEIDGGGASSPD